MARVRDPQNVTIQLQEVLEVATTLATTLWFLNGFGSGPTKLDHPVAGGTGSCNHFGTRWFIAKASGRPFS